MSEFLRNLRGLSVIAVGLAVVLGLFAGCEKGAEGVAAGSGKKTVVTTFTILQDMAANVAGEYAVVASITKPGAEIHDYEPTPRDIVVAQKADLVLRNGLGLERWFERFMGSVKDVASKDLSEGIEPMGIGEGPYQGKPNPHAWMSPANVVVYVENIRKALSEVDPANAAGYAANAAAYTAKIKAIDAELKEKLGKIPAEQRWLVTSEGAFSYLARDYGMRELALWPVNADEEGTPQQIQRVIDTVRANKIPVVFSESTISDKAQRQVARETGAKFGGLLYVDSLTEAGGEAPTFVKLLEFNADVLVKAFEGSAK